MKLDGDYYSGFETLKECEIKILSDKERKHVHAYYGDKLAALEDWARALKDGDTVTGKEAKHAIFNSLANGHADTFSNVNFAAQLNSVKYQLEVSHKEVLKLRAENSKIPTLNATKPEGEL